MSGIVEEVEVEKGGMFFLESRLERVQVPTTVSVSLWWMLGSEQQFGPT